MYVEVYAHGLAVQALALLATFMEGLRSPTRPHALDQLRDLAGGGPNG